MVPTAQALIHDLQRKLQSEAGQNEAGQKSNTEFLLEVEKQARSRIGRMLRGIEAYRQYPYQRQVDPPETVWRDGTSRILDFGPLNLGTGARRPVLLIPSLVNRSYILDLQQQHSFARALSAAGHRVFLLDWDAPGQAESGFDLTAYVNRAGQAITACADLAARPVAVLGYCMGGLLALAAAIQQAQAVSTLIVMATPWDFHADRADQAQGLSAMLPMMEPILERQGEMPIDLLQALFAGLDPMLALKKFAAFLDRDPTSEAAQAFVALEDWLNDGVPLTAPVARECIGNWYGENSPARGTWRIGGEPVDPARWEKPSLAVIPAADRIVPPASARALAEALTNCQCLVPTVGHIGMVTARSAPDKVWQPIIDYLSD